MSHTSHKKMGLDYWASLAETSDDPQAAAELRQAARTLDLSHELIEKIRRNYTLVQFDDETNDIISQLEALHSSDVVIVLPESQNG